TAAQVWQPLDGEEAKESAESFTVCVSSTIGPNEVGGTEQTTRQAVTLQHALKENHHLAIIGVGGGVHEADGAERWCTGGERFRQSGRWVWRRRTVIIDARHEAAEPRCFDIAAGNVAIHFGNAPS